ncbi:MAG: nitroreductase family protein [Planctomycetota bacterium]|nr:nitroreductase family protein [Planctomycetota bacterium]
MSLEELVVKARSYRRFAEPQRLERKTLEFLVNVARRVPSAGNRQPLRYLLLHEAEACARMFPYLRWAGALKDWGGPKEGERPAAYIIVLTDTDVSREAECDAGIAAQTIQLAAAERGFGMCMLGAIERPKIQAEFKVPERYQIVLVLALGVPAEKIVLEEAPASGDVTYYRDAHDVHHVPKRMLKDIVLGD